MNLVVLQLEMLNLEISVPQGYVPRQALYACKTCYGKFETEECAGVCLACSLECHDGHELFELYTKRFGQSH